VDATAPKYARGHVLQPEWTGEESIRERYDAVKTLVRGSSLLDIGSASRYRREGDWMHGLIAAESPDVVGIDIDEEAVAAIKESGLDVRLGDARDFDLGRKFEVAFAGELIEHLDDVRGFLRSVRRHLLPYGRLVLTTPNPFYFANFIYRYGGHARVHYEHTCWFCEDTIKRVLEVNGFSDVKVSFTGHTSPSKLRQGFVSVLRHFLPPRLALDTIVVVASPST
jgi:2-polyprenyl-3-methyl-5-hydroxy-6-metoxy-1,4-benzoquinol methylase